MIPISPLFGSPGATAPGRVHDLARFDDVPLGWSPLQELAVEAARVAEVPMSAINVMTASVQRTVAAVGAEPTLRARVDSMCHRILGEGRTVHVEDASRDARLATNPFVDGRWGTIRFYGAHPLITSDGSAVGTLCVLDSRPRVLEPAEVARLDALAARAVDVLEGWHQTSWVA